MKKSVIIFLCVVCFTQILPIFTVKNQNTTKKAVTVSSTKIDKASVKKTDSDDGFKIKISKTGKVIKLSAKEYLFGCVASEMPISYNEEALKAQTVVAYTYALRKKENSKEEYDLTDDYKIDQCYLQNDEIKEKWGSSYTENAKKLNRIIDSTANLKITYNGETALTVYHAISNGKTLNAKEVWGTDIPYLRSVDSSFDKLSEKYQTVVCVKKQDFADDFKEASIGKADDITSVKVQKSDSGKTEFLCIGNKKIPSGDLVSKYSLRSGSFDARIVKNDIVFYVFGYGHGVGMSQNGANCMAKNGSSYKEIILHYYKGCKIEKG